MNDAMMSRIRYCQYESFDSTVFSLFPTQHQQTRTCQQRLYYYSCSYHLVTTRGTWVPEQVPEHRGGRYQNTEGAYCQLGLIVVLLTYYQFMLRGRI